MVFSSRVNQLYEMQGPAARPSFWQRYDPRTAYYREAWLQLLGQLNQLPPLTGSGRGLVFCAGGVRLFTHLWVNLCLLRRVLKCDLPIEVWHFGTEELTSDMARLLEPFAVRLVDGAPLAQNLPLARGRGFALKTLAVLHNSFEEMLYLDVDSYARRDPSYLFDETAYRWTGACFWPDIWKTNPHSLIWSILGLPYEEEYEWESGQLLLDKRRTWKALRLVEHLNHYYPFYYGHVYGDKMTYYAAWKKLGQSYALTQSQVRATASPMLQIALEQSDLRGTPLFHHRTTSDWPEDGTGVPEEPAFEHLQACAEFLRELHEKWPSHQRYCQAYGPVTSTYRAPSAFRVIQSHWRAPEPSPVPTPEPVPAFNPQNAWDHTAGQALKTPALATPRLMGSGVEALQHADRTTAESILRFFAVMIFLDNRLTDLLPEDPGMLGTELESAWRQLQTFAKQARERLGGPSLRCIRGNFSFWENDTYQSRPEQELLRALVAYVGASPLPLWQECVKRFPPSVTKTATESRPAAAQTTWRARPRADKVLVLTPIKNAVELAESYFCNLEHLNYPTELLSLGLLESDSNDGTYAAFSRAANRLNDKWRRVQLWKEDCQFHIPEGLHRWSPAVQLKRRCTLARCRNSLFQRALQDEDWVLWLDVDVIEYPPNIIEQLLSYGKDLLHPHCVCAYGSRTFDCNAWRDHGRTRMDALRGQEILAPLDAVGGTMLFIRADLHRRGLIFPTEPYGKGNPRIRNSGDCYDPDNPGEVETEGLGIMANDMGAICWGLPELEILHRNR